jgi:hypothetical protein
MAIGKVGSFATVEPALVDFGSMVERNIDKIKAEEQAKAQAKAAEKKLNIERAKDLKLPPPFEVTTLNNPDMKFRDMGQGLFNDMTKAKLEFEETGSGESKQEFERLNYTYGILANSVKSVADNIPKFSDPVYLKGKNLFIANERLGLLKELDEEGRMRVDERDILVKKPDGNEFSLASFVPVMMNIPEEYNYPNFIKSIKDNTNTSVTSGGSYSVNFTRENILDPASESQRKYILNAVKAESLNDSALIDYSIKKGLKDEYGLTKTSGFTEEEKEEWANQTYQDIINSFPSKEDKKFGAPDRSGASGGGSGDKKTFAPTVFDASKKYTAQGATGRGLAWSGDIKESPVLGSFNVQRTSDGKKTNLQITNATLKNLFVNKDGNVIMSYDEQIGNLSEREVQDKLSAIDKLISQGNIEEANKERETLKTQTSKVKGTNILTIRRSDEDLLGMIANSMGLGSTSELLGQLDKLAGKEINTSGY